jgi:hypothetical protein
MIWTIAIIFALVWVIGLVTATTLGGGIHGLAAAAFVLLLVGTFRAGTKSGRRHGPVRPAVGGAPSGVPSGVPSGAPSGAPSAAAPAKGGPA